MRSLLLVYLSIYSAIIMSVLSFQTSPRIKIYHVTKTSWKNGVTCNYENIIKNSKVFFSFKKRKNTGSTRKCQISASLKEKVSLIFHGESDVSLLEKLIASTSYILPLMDAVQAFVMPLLNMLPPSMHKFLLQIERINHMYSSIPFLSFGTFMCLYFLFVKENKFKFHYFIRYHHMQSLILSMFGYALALFYFRVFPYSYNDTDIFNLTILYSTMAIYFGSLIIPFISSLIGYYIEIPVISEAIKLHIGEKKKEDEES
ncbi:apicoplast import protein Tic20, putative [Plasmodium ovale]|uniref:Apicoplast import protein Tic20, putative n=2 Tax=Plasmodium ovale TaxID=36330 RepID=A0A1C3KT46_PLAOA|nr:apicoplast import protein Tic20, putative [Plasmodium ovale]